MAHLVHTGAICSKLEIQAAKVPFGGTQLVSAAFGVQLGTEWAERVASYGITGRFDTNLGALIIQNPQLLQNILRFRRSSEGKSFRKEIGETLKREPGAEFTASVNAGIERNISSNILQRGHDKFQSLMTDSAKFTPVPVVWGDLLHSDNSTKLWRRKSYRMLLDMCQKRGIRKEDPCICGSGEKLRLCCLRPLLS